MDSSAQHQLIERCRQNNRSAQLRLYKQYCEGMFRIAYRLLDNVEDAEDVTQEAFINAFQKITQYRGEVTFGAWLKKIVINKSLDAIKRKKKRRQLEQDSIAEAPVEDDDWEVESNISIEEIKKAMYTLPDKYRSVVMLYLIEGYAHEEIAQILDISVIASRTQLMRGKQKLKTLLKQQYYGSGY